LAPPGRRAPFRRPRPRHDREPSCDEVLGTCDPAGLKPGPVTDG